MKNLDAILDTRMQQLKEDIKAEVFQHLKTMSVRELMDALHGGGPGPARAPATAKRGPGRPKREDSDPTAGGPVMVERILNALAQADRPLALGEICRMVHGGKGYVSDKLSKLRRAGKTEMRGDKASAKHGLAGRFNDEDWKSVMGKDYTAPAPVAAALAADTLTRAPAPAAEAPAVEETPVVPVPATVTASKKLPAGVHRRPKRAAAG